MLVLNWKRLDALWQQKRDTTSKPSPNSSSLVPAQTKRINAEVETQRPVQDINTEVDDLIDHLQIKARAMRTVPKRARTERQRIWLMAVENFNTKWDSTDPDKRFEAINELSLLLKDPEAQRFSSPSRQLFLYCSSQLKTLPEAAGHFLDKTSVLP